MARGELSSGYQAACRDSWASGRGRLALRSPPWPGLQPPKQRARMHFITQHDTRSNGYRWVFKKGEDEEGEGWRQVGEEGMGMNWAREGSPPKASLFMISKSFLYPDNCGFLFY